MHYKNYLIQRGSRFSFRMKVPVRLRPLLGKIEIRRALGTADHSLARMHAQRMAWITLRLFEAMNKNKINLTSQQIRDHLDGWYDQMLERDLEVAKSIEMGLWGQTKADYQNSLEHIPYQLTDLLEAIVDRGREPNRPDWDQPKVPTDEGREEALKQAESFMKWMGEDRGTVAVLSGELPRLDELEESQRRELLIAFLMKAVKVYSNKQHQQAGVASGTTRRTPNPQQMPVAQSSPEGQAAPTRTLSEAWALYHADRGASRETWNGKLPDTARLAYTDLLALCGDVPVNTITREQCKDFRDLQAVKPKDKLKGVRRQHI